MFCCIPLCKSGLHPPPPSPRPRCLVLDPSRSGGGKSTNRPKCFHPSLPCTFPLSGRVSWTMTVVELYPDRLPLEPITSSSCLKEWFRCSEAYYSILRAERHAIERAKANPTSLKARDNAVFARVARYFLIELFNRRKSSARHPAKHFCCP